MMTLPRFPVRPAALAAAAWLFDLLAADAHAGFGTYFSGMATRSRVVQVCVGAMALALFILMKKFTPHEPWPRSRRT